MKRVTVVQFHQTRRWCVAIGLIAAWTASASAQDASNDEDQPYLPGLLATYVDAEGSKASRLDDAVAFHWRDQRPDLRLAASPFSANWRGLLWARGSGEYRLHVFATGEVEVRLAGKTVIARQRLKDAWAASQPVPLEFDRHPIEVEYRQTESSARIGLFWSGPQFSLEPISPRFLFHDRRQTISSDFECGRLLAMALRCGACHDPVERDSLALPAPSLANLGGNLRADWLTDWLMEPRAHDRSGSALRRMPSFGLPREEAEAIAAYLIPPAKAATSPKSTSPQRKVKAPSRDNAPKSQGKSDKPEPPSAKQGERLFLSLGCLACHQLGKLGESSLFGGGDLTTIGDKRPAGFFIRWLEDPAQVNRHHRMPVFELTNDERTGLSLYLAQQARQAEPPANPDADERLSARGRELASRHRCGACHELPGNPERPARIANVALVAPGDWSRSCAAARNESKSGFGYSLTLHQRQELQAYFRSQSKGAADMSPDGATLLVANNCLACHARDGFAAVNSVLPTKLADKLAAVGELHEELAPLIPAMTPPSLNSVGDKLHDAALVAAIRRSGPPYRSYLQVRMPKFSFGDTELSAIAAHLVATDRIPAGSQAGRTRPAVQHSALAVAGGRLVSTDGFGCVSCHQIGSVVPDKAPLNARGPALTQIEQRIRHEWFDRFVADPSRIVPRMEMPSVRIPVKGVLGDNVNAQLAAVWHAINTPDFQPPEPNPVRILRTSGIAERNEAPVVINDVVKTGDRVFVHPLVIGLTNRQNFLYDLSDGRLAAWWLGDAARQRTKGKSWHWEPGGPMVMRAGAQTPELRLLRGGKELIPRRRGQHVAELHDYAIADGRIRLSYSQVFDVGEGSGPAVKLDVVEVWRTDDSTTRAGTVRELTVTWNVEAGDRLLCELLPERLANQSSLATEGQQEIRLANGTIRIADQGDGWSLAAGGLATSPPISAGAKSVALRITYSPLIRPDTIDAPTLSFPVTQEVVEITPGFSGRRLPLPGDIMPTALAWRRDPASPANDELIVGSLKGQVIGARDSDRDGLEDAATLLADGLATPYGIADGGDSLHVLTKSALVGVKNGEVKVLAWGWGHTDDYHDWAVGLPRNEKGEYFVGLPCQQDERSIAAARYRGAMLKLVPRMPTADDSRRYDIQVVSTGHRFPMGLALNRERELFVTDNQGNYNPFNELNHVRPGAFFGFINANEKRDKGFQTPPLIEPAIDIPHPWTRSVNGICFLNSPTSQSTFGPLTGHLIGCEYDTRRLVRMTIQRVGDTYQGAAYPLSLEPSSPEKGLLGPIVCAVSQRGELYVGNIRDSGWGAGNNIGDVVQVRVEPDQLPAGIAEVRAVADGFEIEFFRAVDAAKAADESNYAIASYRRESTPAYGGPDLDRRIEKIGAVAVAPDCRRVTLKLSDLRAGCVYELQLKNLTADGSLFHPAEAHYTLRQKITP